MRPDPGLYAVQRDDPGVQKTLWATSNVFMESRLIGGEMLVERLMIGLLAGGHLLVEGAPGLAKTRAVKLLSQGLHAPFARIQCTPDLMPADLTGSSIFRPTRARSNTCPGRSSIRSSSSTRSTGRRRRCNLPCSKPWPSTRSRRPASPTRLPDPFHGGGDAEPDRARRHVPAAGGAARPLHAEGRGVACRTPPWNGASSIWSRARRTARPAPDASLPINADRDRRGSHGGDGDVPVAGRQGLHRSPGDGGRATPQTHAEIAGKVEHPASPRGTLALAMAAKAKAYLVRPRPCRARGRGRSRRRHPVAPHDPHVAGAGRRQHVAPRDRRVPRSHPRGLRGA